MIRQAHTYLVGAVGGATLIAIAIAAFVLLVSAQVFRDWPLAALGSGDDTAAVAEAQPAGGSGSGAVAGGGAFAAIARAASEAAGRRADTGLRGNDGAVDAGGDVDAT